MPESRQIAVSHCSFYCSYLSNQFARGQYCMVNSAATKLILLKCPLWQIIIRARCRAYLFSWLSFMAQSKWSYVSGLDRALCAALWSQRQCLPSLVHHQENNLQTSGNPVHIAGKSRGPGPLLGVAPQLRFSPAWSLKDGQLLCSPGTEQMESSLFFLPPRLSPMICSCLSLHLNPLPAP